MDKKLSARPFYKKKRFAIPLGSFLGLLVLGAILPSPDPEKSSRPRTADTAAAGSTTGELGPVVSESTTPRTSSVVVETTLTEPTPVTTEVVPSRGKSLAEAYPVICRSDRIGDSRYEEGDIVAGKVALQGDGLLFSWTTKKAPRLLPGDWMNYFAKYTVEEPFLVSNFNMFLAMGNDGRLETQAWITNPSNWSADFSKEVRVIEEGATVTVWLPGSHAWNLVGSSREGLFNNGLLTAGKWELLTNRNTSTPGARPGADDYCGVDDSERIAAPAARNHAYSTVE